MKVVKHSNQGCPRVHSAERLSTAIRRKFRDPAPRGPLTRPCHTRVHIALRGRRLEGDAGHREIDNNRTERSLRGLAIGRKNWLVTGSPAPTTPPPASSSSSAPPTSTTSTPRLPPRHHPPPARHTNQPTRPIPPDRWAENHTKTWSLTSLWIAYEKTPMRNQPHGRQPAPDLPYSKCLTRCVR